MEFHILTIFPFIFEGFLKTGMVKIAIQKNLARVHLHNFRYYTTDKHRKVDDTPYGGGPGMLLKPEPIFYNLDDIFKTEDFSKEEDSGLVLLTPQGKPFEQAKARELAKKKKLIFLCGRYEGFDERIRTGLPVEEISIGDYVLSGGEIPAMVIMDAVIRLIPGVLGDERSVLVESFSENLLDFPQYTKPPEFRGMKVPDILLSGHHEKIAQWRKEKAWEKTQNNRQDLLEDEK